MFSHHPPPLDPALPKKLLEKFCRSQSSNRGLQHKLTSSVPAIRLACKADQVVLNFSDN